MKILILTLIPTLLLVIALLFKFQAGPYWIGINSDPDYIYLLNSLSLARLKPSGFYFHPGTPLQLLGVPVILTTHFFHTTADLVTSVLSDPELYLQAISITILIVLTLTVFYTGYQVYRLTKRLSLALIFQFTPFLASYSLVTLHRVSPEPLLLVTGYWFSYLVLRSFVIGKTFGLKNIICLSLVTGMFLSLKINSLPVLIIPVLFLPGYRKLQYLLFSVLSFVLLTLPFSSFYSRMFSWYLTLLLHSGYYGTGRIAMPDLPLLLKNIITIFMTNPVILLILIFLFLALLDNYKNKKSCAWYKYSIGLFLFISISVLITTKQLYFRYLLPVYSLSGLTVIVLTLIYPRLLKWIITAVVFLGLINISISSLNFIATGQSRKEALSIQYLLDHEYKNSLIINYYGSSSRPYALRYANEYSNFFYTSQLSVLYPSRYFLNLGYNTISDWQHAISLKTGKNIIFRGVPLSGEYARFKPPLPLSDIYHGRLETLYINY